MKYGGKRCFGILMLAVCGVIAGCSAQRVYQDQQKVRGVWTACGLYKESLELGDLDLYNTR